jgi:hypothetical protein
VLLVHHLERGLLLVGQRLEFGPHHLILLPSRLASSLSSSSR